MKIHLPLMIFVLVSGVQSSDLVEITAVTDNILMLHFDDGYVEHFGLGQGDNDDSMTRNPFSTVKGTKTTSYLISSDLDENYIVPKEPIKVGRKSKGKDFTRNWPDLPYVSEHFIYLTLPFTLKQGISYKLELDRLAKNSDEWYFVFDLFSMLSETIHINQIGYAPKSPAKFAYLSHWMGDTGPLNLDDYSESQFHIFNNLTDQVVYSGEIKKRKDLEQGGADCAYDSHAPYGSFTGADVWLLDFSDFVEPGEYKIVVDRIGCSYPFRIDEDVYREPFFTTIRGLYHQRCGTALQEPYTHWIRDRCHHPAETDTVILSDWMYMDSGNAFQELAQFATGEKRPFYGGWHDAADWDRHHYHLDACQMLLLSYEFRPENFSDDELNIPESGDGIPDILNETQWCVDFYVRMQNEQGGIHGGLETWRHPADGVSCVTDTDQWYAYAPDPIASFHYAGVACHLAFCLELAGFPEYKELYISSALKAYEWALENTSAQDYDLMQLRDKRHYAAAWLFKMTGDDIYQQQFKQDNKVKNAATELEVWESHDQQWGIWTFVTTNQPNIDKTLKEMLIKATENWAYSDHINNAKRRGYCFGKDWWQPVMVAHATTPNIFPVMVAYHITGNEEYLKYCYTSVDYTLGANPLNMCWVPGIGEKYPKEYMHLDSWYYNTERGMVPGIIPYGPYNYTDDHPDGPWEASWGLKTTYPNAQDWPSHELWFENRYCPIVNEFTVHQTIGPAAAAFGFLCHEGGKYTHVENEITEPINSFFLFPCYPNPFNAYTTINFTLKNAAFVRIAVYNVSGQLVKLLAERYYETGANRILWNGCADSGHPVASGLYFVKAEAEGHVAFNKLILTR